MDPFIAVSFIVTWLIPRSYPMSEDNVNQTPPELSLTSYKLFVKNRLVQKNHSNIWLPRVFEELLFECNSTTPTKWIFDGQQAYEPSVKEFEINKWRSPKINGSVGQTAFVFRSTLKISFDNPSEMFDITCESICVKNSSCQKLKTCITPVVNSAFFDLQLHHGNKTTKKLKGDQRPRRNIDCKYALYVDFENGKYACTFANNSDMEAPSIFIPCNNPDECDKIYQHDDRCNQTDAFHSNCSQDFCYEIRDITSPFIIACGEANQRSIARSFFKTLNSFLKREKTIYEYHRKSVRFAKMHLLDVKMNVSSAEKCGCSYGKNTEVVYTKHTREFICTALRSFFSYGFRWILIYGNGTEKDLGMGAESINATEHWYISRRTIYFDSASIKSVKCEAPTWNSIHGTNYTLSVTVQDSIQPGGDEFGLYAAINNVRRRDVTVISTTQAQNLTCNRTGVPPAVIAWAFDGVKPTGKDGQNNDHYSISNSDGSSVVLLQPNHPYSEVSCTASNAAGRVILNFKLQKAPGFETTIIIIISASSGLLLFVVVFLALWKIRRQRQLLNLTKDEIHEFHHGNPDASDAFLVPYNMDLEVSLEHFTASDHILGSGSYGKVVKGRYGVMDVAIKTLKKSSDIVYFKALLSELKVMSYVGRHPNIVNLLGACTQNIKQREVFIILEYCERGDIVTLLRKNRDIFVNYFETHSVNAERMSIVEYQNTAVKKLSTLDLVRWCIEIARGMEFLSNKNVIHGDLAGRNILITECLNAKVSDFGLAKQLLEYSTYVQKTNIPLPLRWMAYESLKDLQFSVQSDVWSYGIVLWEIFSLGETPYPGMEWCFESWKDILNGMRNEKPTYASDSIYRFMCECWNLEPKMRPSFENLWKSILDYSNEVQGHFGNHIL